jgi:hypothetical protein
MFLAIATCLWPASIQAAIGAAGRLADSSDFVHLVKVARGEKGEIIITLGIEDGFHINANPASEPYLIPTSVHFAGIAPDHVAYPSAVRFKPKFSEEPIDVYEGMISIIAVFRPTKLDGVRHLRVTVTVQACTDQICFPPADLMGSS